MPLNAVLEISSVACMISLLDTVHIHVLEAYCESLVNEHVHSYFFLVFVYNHDNRSAYFHFKDPLKPRFPEFSGLMLAKFNFVELNQVLL